jgi:DNA-binding IclR family transcriptional regulator
MAGHSSVVRRSVTNKVAAILLACSPQFGRSMAELARAADLPVSTTHRLIGELVARRLLERTEGGKYRIGLPLRMVAAAAPNSLSPFERLRPMLQEFANMVRSEVRLGTLEDEAVSYAEFIPGSASPTDSAKTGMRYYETAMGFVLVAFAAPDLVNALLAREGVAKSAMRQTLSTTRISRVAIVTDQSDGGRGGALAMPIFGPGGNAYAAVEVTVPDLAAGLSCARVALAVATASLSRDLATFAADGTGVSTCA